MGRIRELESGERYAVPYAPRRILESGLARLLTDLHGRDSLRGLSVDSFAMRMAQLYADLDYLHPFSEGNSRTLRMFTRHLARAVGFDLDWSPSNADGVARDRLYQARDVAVIHRAFPELDEQRAMVTDDRMEYETFWVLQKLQQASPLEALIREYVTPFHSSQQSRARDNELER